METAEECRQRGNELLQRGDFADAAQQYDQGLVALLPCQAGFPSRMSHASGECFWLNKPPTSADLLFFGKSFFWSMM